MANKYDTCTFLDKEGTGVFVAIIMRSVTYYIFFFNISISQKRKIYLIFDIKYANPVIKGIAAKDITIKIIFHTFL